MTTASDAAPAGEFLTRSEGDTFALAERLGRSFSGREVVLLFGGLGAGKTVFAKGLAAGLGVSDPGDVCSPSYCLVNVYRGRVDIYHLDLYRLSEPREILDLGWEDYLGEGVVVVEWAEKVPFDLAGWRVIIEPGEGDERRIRISRDDRPGPRPA